MKKYGLFLFFGLLVLSSISYFFYFSIVNFAPPSLNLYNVTCNSNPGIITQSVTLCPGVYYDGIEIRASNVHLKCSGATFIGGGPNATQNGLLINGSYTDILVEDCNFAGFQKNGILLIGPSTSTGTSTTVSKLSKVILKNVTSESNGEDGLEIRENTHKIDVLNGNYRYNGLDGINLISDYRDPARILGTVFEPYPRYFPNDVRIINSSILVNGNNGINVDAGNYYRFLNDTLWENNSLIIEGNAINGNLQNGIKSTDFFVSGTGAGSNNPDYHSWHYQQLGFYAQLKNDTFYLIGRNNITENWGAGVKIQTLKRQGNPFVVCDSPTYPIYSNPGYPSRFAIAISNLDYLYWNRIENNLGNGVEVVIDSGSSNPWTSTPCGGSNSPKPHYYAGLKYAFANIVRNNSKSGFYFNLKDPRPTVGTSFDFTTKTNTFLVQNIISDNKESGIFNNGTSVTPGHTIHNEPVSTGYGGYWKRDTSILFTCNDLIQNQNYGVRFDSKIEDIYNYLGNQNVYVTSEDLGRNIIENNSIGGLYINYTKDSYWMFSRFASDYYGDNSLFNIYIRSRNVSTSSFGCFRTSDIINSPLLAYIEGCLLSGIHPTSRYNYWSDYSPTCSPISGGSCVNSRYYPLNGVDVSPKATTLWGIKNRGYLGLDQGLLIANQTICQRVEIPHYIPRTPLNLTIPSGGTGTGGTGGNGTSNYTGDPSHPESPFRKKSRSTDG